MALLTRNFSIRHAALCAAVAAATCAVSVPTFAQICPFDNGGSTLAVDGMILARYSQGVTGAPLVAGTNIPAASAGTVADSITSAASDLRITGNAAITPVDSLIISRKIAGLRGNALTDGLNLGSGSRNTPAAVQSFLLAGCAGTAWVQGGNAFGVPGVMGTTDAQPLRIQSGGNNLSVLFSATQHGLRLANVADANLSAVNTINGAAVNSVVSGVINATIAGGGASSTPANPNPNLPNQVTGNSGTIGGGLGNTAVNLATIAGGQENLTVGPYAFIGGGYRNNAASNAVVSGGSLNVATGQGSVVGGGFQNKALNAVATIAGGQGNIASGQYSAAIGGNTNSATGDYSSVLGGYRNFAGGSASVVGGTQSNASHFGSFVWADASSASATYLFPSTAINQFRVRATGGVEFVTAIDGAGTPTRTVSINPNGTLDFGSVTRQAINLWGGGGQYGSGVQALLSHRWQQSDWLCVGLFVAHGRRA